MLTAGLAIGLGFAGSAARPIDTDMIWRAGQMDHYYGVVWAADGDSRYVYPPPLAQLTGILRPVGWKVFVIGWTVLVFGGLWAATRRWSPLVLAVAAAGALWTQDSAPAAPLTQALVGNLQPVLAAAIVVGMRWPALWAIVILTKIAPGIGLIWFLARGEWRNVAIASGTTAIIVVVSLVLAPGAWADFVTFAVANADTPSPKQVVPIPLLWDPLESTCRHASLSIL